MSKLFLSGGTILVLLNCISCGQVNHIQTETIQNKVQSSSEVASISKQSGAVRSSSGDDEVVVNKSQNLTLSTCEQKLKAGSLSDTEKQKCKGLGFSFVE